MPKIEIRARYTLLRSASRPLGSGTFVCPHTEPAATVRIESTGAIHVDIASLEVSDSAIAALKADQSGRAIDWASDAHQEIAQLSGMLNTASRSVVALVKYHMGHVDISENLLSSNMQEWRLGTTDWAPILRTLSISGESIWSLPIDERSSEMLQDSLNRRVTPLLAMRHLQRAKNEFQPHHKWIDATIAAELAIKEILIRARPELEALLIAVPSPPLEKLYGPIIETYLGKRSPYVGTLRDGATMRNRLVHKPAETQIDRQEASDYVQDVEIAIFHALRTLYPDDALLKQAPRGIGRRAKK